MRKLLETNKQTNKEPLGANRTPLPRLASLALQCVLDALSSASDPGI